MINWAGFIPAAVLASLVPGASQLLGLNNAVRHGMAHALAGIGGRLAAFVILIGLVVGGLGAVLATSAAWLAAIKWLGVAYLVWIGFSSLRRARRAPSSRAAAEVTRSGLRPVVAHEFFVALSNPKALLVFAALIPQFTGGAPADAGTQIAVLGAAYLVVELVVGLGYITVGNRIGATGISARTMRRIDFGTGVCFVALAALLAADDLATI